MTETAYTASRFAKRMTFADRTGINDPFCVVQGPILLDGEKIDAHISRADPLIIRSSDNLGVSEMLTSFVVLRDDLTFPEDRGPGEWAIGGIEVCIPPQTSHPDPARRPDSTDYDWALVRTDEMGEWWRVWVQVKPEFVYG